MSNKHYEVADCPECGKRDFVEKDDNKWVCLNCGEHEYESVKLMQGSMSQQNCPNKDAFERAQYMRSLQTFKPEWAHVYEPSPYFG